MSAGKNMMKAVRSALLFCTTYFFWMTVSAQSQSSDNELHRIHQEVLNIAHPIQDSLLNQLSGKDLFDVALTNLLIQEKLRQYLSSSPTCPSLDSIRPKRPFEILVNDWFPCAGLGDFLQINVPKLDHILWDEKMQSFFSKYYQIENEVMSDLATVDCMSNNNFALGYGNQRALRYSHFNAISFLVKSKFQSFEAIFDELKGQFGQSYDSISLVFNPILLNINTLVDHSMIRQKGLPIQVNNAKNDTHSLNFENERQQIAYYLIHDSIQYQKIITFLNSPLQRLSYTKFLMGDTEIFNYKYINHLNNGLHNTSSSILFLGQDLLVINIQALYEVDLDPLFRLATKALRFEM